ncbi:ATP synthase F1 subunit gamma [Armatimonas rosea]|uniref:ATP synthase gamma chain n=1 Tax=Armatimonas rosea TaxID=685828 RepID=A0A7W9SLM4_ARMRO|nr:ATP synthase F1 subunit gamma [Armatimonas rosea]MBB6048906.1 F-type H+-transporting ATPase subunit gamma [Armatimonas rosea]
MPSMRQIRGRIRTAKNIQQITKAMKMVAAARLKRAQDRVVAARPYANKMKEVMGSLSKAGAGNITHPLLEVRAPEKVGIVVISADRGLCGSYSTNLLKKVQEVLRTGGVEGGAVTPETTKLLLAGRKAQTYFRRRPYAIVGEFTLNMTNPSFAEAQEIAKQARDLYTSGEVDVIYLVYTKFLSALVQKPMAVQMLPMVAEDDIEASGTNEDYIFEPDAETLFGNMLPRSVDTLVYQALIESVASEHGARMTAMSSATDNAGKMIAGLTLAANRARQAGITKELAEIVGGADALKG